ncbi:hypothetical protein FEM48_Zijuj04G0180200 [Ziziphus jujuba var. spinosa]|uniref:Glutaredoxin domain-containing protein n=1 Tax=Ziziphus jujuba var. spinosa TaxID=714518 RepID=A0A978VLC7_ZIZJJ|nr:hypothetical protein FEM48_Zijuj04G0180200 [Ziziphus jujuba var. spinosa]
MGCVSSNLLHHDDEFTQLGSSALSHHIVSLKSSTYGLLTLDPPPPPNHPTTPPTPPSRFTLGSIFPTPLSEPKSLWSEPRPPRTDPEVINSWELMAGLDADSFRFSPIPPPKPFAVRDPIAAAGADKENSNPNRNLKPLNDGVLRPPSKRNLLLLDRFENICPSSGENRVVVYTTTLRGVRSTFEACNAVRSALQASGVTVCERDVSMDRGFRDELRELMRGKGKETLVPPRVFVKGRYIGGAEEVLKIAEEGLLGEILEGLPKRRTGSVCEGCGDVRFLPCFRCNGSCKMVMAVKEEMGQKQGGAAVVVRCPDCNENGLVLCPICS